MRYLITAGPTREYLDDVRFLSNASSGAMGYALADAAAKAGHEVALVSGPSNLDPPTGVELVSVVSADEMYRAVVSRFGETDCVVMNAAVCDYRPSQRHRGKLKKAADALVLQLVRTPDILAELGRRKGRQLLIGFALEAENPLANAREKLESKRLDYIVVNAPETMGAETITATILGRDGSHWPLEEVSKEEAARKIVDLASRAAAARVTDGNE